MYLSRLVFEYLKVTEEFINTNEWMLIAVRIMDFPNPFGSTR